MTCGDGSIISVETTFLLPISVTNDNDVMSVEIISVDSQEEVYISLCQRKSTCAIFGSENLMRYIFRVSREGFGILEEVTRLLMRASNSKW